VQDETIAQPHFSSDSIIDGMLFWWVSALKMPFCTVGMKGKSSSTSTLSKIAVIFIVLERNTLLSVVIVTTTIFELGFELVVLVLILVLLRLVRTFNSIKASDIEFMCGELVLHRSTWNGQKLLVGCLRKNQVRFMKSSSLEREKT